MEYEPRWDKGIIKYKLGEVVKQAFSKSGIEYLIKNLKVKNSFAYAKTNNEGVIEYFYSFDFEDLRIPLDKINKSQQGKTIN